MLTSGMELVEPEKARELLQLVTVMGWKLKLPLHIMRDDTAGRWFMKGPKGKSDFWIRDTDIDNLKATPMWASVKAAPPYGLGAPTPLHPDDPLGEEAKELLRQVTGARPPQIIIDDPVEEERKRAAKTRLEAEEALRKLDEWE